jgi:imidazoleglycerol-phosphate dehydratase
METNAPAMARSAAVDRKTSETDIAVKFSLDGSGDHDIATGIGFFDHMLTLLAVHGLFDLSLRARGDLEVDGHHTVEDVGLVLGDALDQSLGDRAGIRRYGHAVVPMDETLAAVTIDLSRRPFLVYTVPEPKDAGGRSFDIYLAKEFFRALAVRGGMTLHINVLYGENEHHMIEAMFKAVARALDDAISVDDRLKGVRSSKGVL